MAFVRLLLLLQLLLSTNSLTSREVMARNTLHFCLNFRVWRSAWSNLTQEIQFLEFLGWSNSTHSHSHYLICMHFIGISTVPPKTDSEDNADACRPLSLRHLCWIQRPSTVVALLRIVAFLISVKQQRGPKMRVQQSQIITPTGSNWMPITDTAVFWTRRGNLASFSWY